MAERGRHPILGRGLYLGLALLIILLQMLPLTAVPTVWPRPDILMALTFVYALRRPRYVPPLLVGAVFFLADLLFMRPPGLLTALVIIGNETLRSRAHGMRSTSMVAEWVLIAAAIMAVTVVERLILFTLLAPVPALGPVLIGALGTAAIVPVVALVGALAFGLRRAAPGELDERGQRI